MGLVLPHAKTVPLLRRARLCPLPAEIATASFKPTARFVTATELLKPHAIGTLYPDWAPRAAKPAPSAENASASVSRRESLGTGRNRQGALSPLVRFMRNSR